MVEKCCAVNCTQKRDKEKGIQLYRFPADPDRRNLWVQAIKRVEYDIVSGKSTRKPWKPNQYHRLCSKHFISGIVITFYQ